MLLATPTETVVKNMVVILIKCSKWDEDGYLIQFARGVLPCNSLAVLTSLTQAALQNFQKYGVTGDLIVYDETVGSGQVQPEKIMREHAGAKIVVGLVGVQTNQFPRARHLALKFTELGAQVVIGGFHVSGSISMLHDGIQDKRD